MMMVDAIDLNNKLDKIAYKTAQRNARANNNPIIQIILQSPKAKDPETKINNRKSRAIDRSFKQWDKDIKKIDTTAA